MLKLIASKTSPYARKVRVALAEKKIEYQMVESSGAPADNPLHAWNPLGKLPVLILDDGTHLFDSRVIVEYIDLVSPVSRLIPEPARQRIAVKKWEALADGICDAAALIVNERRRPGNQQSGDWLARQRRKIDEGPPSSRASSASAHGATARTTRSPTSPRAAHSAISICATPSSTGAICIRISLGLPRS